MKRRSSKEVSAFFDKKSYCSHISIRQKTKAKNQGEKPPRFRMTVRYSNC